MYYFYFTCYILVHIWIIKSCRFLCSVLRVKYTPRPTFNKHSVKLKNKRTYSRTYYPSGIEKIETIIKTLKNNRFLWKDNIYSELPKMSGKENLINLHQIITIIWNSEQRMEYGSHMDNLWNRRSTNLRTIKVFPY